MQTKKELGEYLDTTLCNKLVESAVPDKCLGGPCILGIDEAGRGPVLGPMVYSIAYYPQDLESVLNKMKFADSKELTETNREKLYESIQTSDGGFRELGFMTKIISPNMISNSMFRRKKYNLNALSHDTAIDLIQSVMDKKIQVAHVYIDTVGPPVKYKEKLQKFFPGTNFTVTEKADSKYAIVSAASVCAKVMRDRIVNNWKYIEGETLHLEAYDLGSGYPADPVTKKFLEGSIDPVFGFPILARFSWSTISKALDKGACKCDFNEPDDDGEDSGSLNERQKYFAKFFQPINKSRTTGRKSAPVQSIYTQTPKQQQQQQQQQPSKPYNSADKFFDSRLLLRNCF